MDQAMADPDENHRSESAANLLSTVGAGVAGLGGGIVLAEQLASFGWWLLGVGAFVHFSAMIGKHRLERRSGYRPTRWEGAAYWLCWLLLAAVAVVVASGFCDKTALEPASLGSGTDD